MKAVLPAAGKGSRLEPRTNSKPKPLVEVCGRPILEYCLEHFTGTDIEELIIVVGYRGKQIIERFGDEYEGIPLTYAWQHEQKGMAHALLQAEEHVQKDFAVMDGDNIICADLSPLIEQQGTPGTNATILLDQLSAQAARQKAICDLDDDNLLTDIVNKPDDPPDPSYVAGGFHTFPPEIFTACKLVRKSSRDEYELSKAIELLIEAGYNVRGVPHDGWSTNINTESELREAKEYLSSNPEMLP